jgi:hypothetical protein
MFKAGFKHHLLHLDTGDGEHSGNIYSASYTAPTPEMLTTAVLDMEAAFTGAAGRPLPDYVEYGESYYTCSVFLLASQVSDIPKYTAGPPQELPDHSRVVSLHICNRFL